MVKKPRRKKLTRSDFIPAGIVPLDTGKVKMGIYYQKPRYVEEDSDMLTIQKWLIGDPVQMRKERIINLCYGIGLVFVLTVIVLKGYAS